MNPNYPLVARRANHRCEYCHAPEIAFNIAFEVEHIEPISSGGTDTEGNLALACRSCNLYKSVRTAVHDPGTSEIVKLFNPRVDRWGDHFLVEFDETIQGISSVGRATVEQLRMNSLQQVRARRRWRMIGLFP